MLMDGLAMPGGRVQKGNLLPPFDERKIEFMTKYILGDNIHCREYEDTMKDAIDVRLLEASEGKSKEWMNDKSDVEEREFPRRSIAEYERDITPITLVAYPARMVRAPS